MHSDAVQAVGQIPVDFTASGLSAMSIAAHKFGGPTGVGALVLRRDTACVPLLHGGGQERDVRSGTPDVAGAVAMAAAARIAVDGVETNSARVAALRDRLVEGVLTTVDDAYLNGARGDGRLPGNSHFTFRGCEGDSLLMLLDAKGIECSTGSACTAGVAQPSHVLIAMGADPASARGSLRLSLGHTSTDADVDCRPCGAAGRGGPGAAGGAGEFGSRCAMRVLVAMSGGVDSSVAAARMVDAGHDVVGVHLALSASPGTLRTGSRGCCSKEDAGDARRVADVLDIPFYVWDFADRFSKTSSTISYRPTPAERPRTRVCAATSGSSSPRWLPARWHWASTRWPPGTTPDYPAVGCAAPSTADKDQSYVLGVLTAEQLRHAVFPIGDTPKPQIREEAARRGLAVADKPDSHDICFIPSGDTRAFLGARIGVRRGAVVDAGGTVLAEHDGVHGFTIGQRKGLGIAGPGPDGRPRYVTAIDADTATVHVGDAADLEMWRLTGERPVFTAGVSPSGPVECAVQVRAHGGIADGVAELRDGHLDSRTALCAAGRGAGPDDGALPARSRRRRSARQRHHQRGC